MLTSEAWRAVALSLDIEPETLWGLRPYADRPFDECPAEFRRRLEIACNHIEGEELRCTDRVANTPYSAVTLADFVTWADARGWSLPDRMRREPAPTDSRMSPFVDGRSAYEERVAAFLKERGRPPPLQSTKWGLQGDREWAVAHDLPRTLVERWRRELCGRQKAGRPKS